MNVVIKREHIYNSYVHPLLQVSWQLMWPQVILGPRDCPKGTDNNCCKKQSILCYRRHIKLM